jgi:hypothetical protein
MNIQEVLQSLLSAKSEAIRGGAPHAYVHGLEHAISIIRIMSRREAA